MDQGELEALEETWRLATSERVPPGDERRRVLDAVHTIEGLGRGRLRADPELLALCLRLSDAAVTLTGPLLQEQRPP